MLYCDWSSDVCSSDLIHVSGFIDGEFKGVLHGSVDALIESKRQELDETEE